MYEFIVKNWSRWPVNVELGAETEILAPVPKNLRRRISHLANNVFCACILCVGKNNDMPIVFSSAHGELAKSFKMMKQLEQGEEISPTTFSLSVHNAIAGLFAIAFNNTRPCIALSPGEDGIAPAFIEAAGLLAEGNNDVLVVFYDEPLISFYPTKPYRLSSDETLAVALWLSNTGDGQAIKFSRKNLVGDDGEQVFQLPLLAKFLSDSGSSLTLKTSRGSWSWEKDENH